MKKFRWVKALTIALIVTQSMTFTYASTIEEEYKMLTTGSYLDATTLTLAYLEIPGFFVSPLQEPGELLAPFNQSRTGYFHEGIDIRAVENTPVFAIADGVVTKAAPDSKGVDQGGGHMVFIDFGNGAEGRYMHLNAYGVKAGDHVKAGQVIGFTGNTGDSSTPHLHFEYRINGIPQDPAFIFEASGMIGNAKPVINAVLQEEKQTNNKIEFESFFVVQS